MIVGWPKRIGARIAMSYLVVLIIAITLFMAATGLVFFLQMRSQLVHYAVQDIETVEGLLSLTASGMVAVREDYHNHPESKRILDRYLEVRSPAGELLYRNDRLKGLNLGPAVPLEGEGVGGYSERTTRLADGTRVVSVSRRHILDGKPVLIRLAYSEENLWRSLEQFVAAAILVLPVMIASAVLVGYRMSRRVLAPVQQITLRAEQITANRLHERLPVSGTGDELDDLAKVINQVLAHLDDAFGHLRQFTADASHELRTPLAAIRGIGEVGLQNGGSEEDYRELVGSMLEEVNRLTRLVEQLLMISRADAGAIPLNQTSFPLQSLIVDAVTLLEPLAEEKRQTIAFQQGVDAAVYADEMYLRQALLNVLHNAIKYSPERAAIQVRLHASVPDRVAIEIEDAGQGIPEEHQGRIFDRFYRVDQGRARSAGGFGLGLAIAHWAVTVNGGTVELIKSGRTGSTFRISLPICGTVPKEATSSS